MVLLRKMLLCCSTSWDFSLVWSEQQSQGMSEQWKSEHGAEMWEETHSSLAQAFSGNAQFNCTWNGPSQTWRPDAFRCSL